MGRVRINYLQIAACDLTRNASPALPSSRLALLTCYAETGWHILWDPTQSTATRPLAIRKDGVWYAYKTADGCKAGRTCVDRHAPEGRGAVRRL